MSGAPIELPEWGMAEEILARLGWSTTATDAPDTAAAPDAPAEPVASLAPSAPVAPIPPETSPAAGEASGGGGEPLYAFVDAISRRDEAPATPEAPESWVVFELAGERYGLPVTAVQEILRVDAITRVPHCPDSVRGITNLRGRVLAVVDLRVRLGLPPATIDERSRILVADFRQRTLGLLVDAAVQVAKLPPSALAAERQDRPGGAAAETSHVLGVFSSDDQRIVALALDRLLPSEEKGR